LEDGMPASNEPDDTRLAGRTPRRQSDDAVTPAGRWREGSEESNDATEAADGDDAIDGSDLDAVTRLMGFLRGDD
jgi:hypothetical protein